MSFINHILMSSQEPLSQFHPNLAQLYPWIKGIQVRANEEMD